ncbi:Gfo/Idh/MocA family protein [Paenibacillus contaminans]|uniref:Gfo/Idh/MocA family oxidoreductase n=1 Tax=Paenibacillus contaminans TaxID=450362 RepID=A0A329MM47_9BACL|nr:Gfo/Idh/MocA family oxidoreductase [Paenibacillus contaminans]RAV20680.1 gfo/Idh/MocA family oxidoreductase [Paenibacillus contaminans]
MTVRVGFIGAGGIANSHLNALRSFEEVTITAICDINAEQAAKVSAQYGAAAYSDFDVMLEKEKLDILFVCVPPFAHGDYEEKSAARGIHLFVEKPLGLEMDVIRRKAEAIRKAGVLSSSGYLLRYQDTTAIAKAYLEDKRILTVRGYNTTKFVRAPWWKVMAKSGGQLVEMTTHFADLMRYFAGDVHTVYANMARLATEEIEGSDIPDVGMVNVVFASGAIGSIENNCIQFERRSGVELMGTGFRVLLDGKSLTIADREKTVVYQERSDGLAIQDKTFIRAVITGDSSLILSPYEDALKTVELTLAANDSAASGLPVNI